LLFEKVIKFVFGLDYVSCWRSYFFSHHVLYFKKSLIRFLLIFQKTDFQIHIVNLFLKILNVFHLNFSILSLLWLISTVRCFILISVW